ncbi:JNK-interacting protein, partial [Fragariocoptes setiger]
TDSGVGLPSSQNPDSDSHVISERVKNLATQIYQELKRIISRCNYDEDVLSGLMPLIVRVLESLDLALIENQQLQVELELCKDDNEQLAVMFEKEKAAKRGIDQKLIETEDAYDEERQQHQQKIESLENIVKMFELKVKNATDQATRLEEKESQKNIEYNKLHDRYSDLLRSHCDVMERVRHLLGNDAADVNYITNPSSGLTVSLEQPQSEVGVAQRAKHREVGITSSGSSKRSEIGSFSETPGRSKNSVWNDTTELTLEDASLVVIDEDDDHASNVGTDKSCNREYSERSVEPEEVGDKDSITYTSMEREFRKLIQENRDLLNTKNALNVVKDDLIAEVDRLSNIVSMYEQEIKQLTSSKDQLRQKTINLEASLRAVKEELAKAQQKIKENDEEGVPYSQRKRFSRVEMAKVLMERNSYKEKLFELQDAVRYTESVRANRVETEKRSSLWKFFSNLFGAPSGPTGSITAGPSNVVGGSRNSSPLASTSSDGVPTAADAIQNLRISSASKSLTLGQRLSPSSDLILLMDTDLASDRKRNALANREVGDRVQAYGWSLADTTAVSAKLDSTGTNQPSLAALRAQDPLSSARLKVPIPLYCRPLSGDSLGMKIWCAAAIDFSGGNNVTPTGPSASLSASPVKNCSVGVGVGDESSAALRSLEAEVSRVPGVPDEQQGDVNLQQRLVSASGLELMTSYVWICSTQHSRSKITIIDIKNKPNNVLCSFYVPTYVYCIASVSGFKSNDLNASSWAEALERANRESSNHYRVVEIDQETTDRLRRRQARKRSSLAASSNTATGDRCSTSDQTNPSNDNVCSNDKPQSQDNVQSATVVQTKEDEISRVLNANLSANVGVQTLQKLDEFVAHTEPNDDANTIEPAIMAIADEPNQYQAISTCLATVWMGGRDRTLYIHSAVGQWQECVAYVELADSILQICHYRGRVFVALANGVLCVFSRDANLHHWDLSRYIAIDIGHAYDEANAATQAATGNTGHRTAGIRCLEIANKYLWLGYKNYVFIVDPVALKVRHSFQMVPQADNQLRQMVSMKDGVFCCLRSDLTLRLYSALDPYQHIQDIDIEPVITRLISPKTFVISRITAMKAVGNRLWVGDAHGIILTIPCDWDQEASEQRQQSDNLTIARYIPRCDVANAQLSFHGHKDAVKFFVHTHNLMLSGGEGYYDFRVAIDDQSHALGVTSTNKSHLILWQLSK